ncbi:MAG TPA: sugar phosphate isomerase/epimerase family protein [Terriglobia bacterium]|jgi:sugar phosphate isomerase/epimerase
MQFGISTQIYRGQPVTVDLLESIRKTGFDRFELFCNRPHLDFHNRGLLRAIGRWFQENALPAPSLHLPFVENTGHTQRIWISVLEPERRQREAALDEIKRSLELANYVQLDYAVMHLGNPKEKFSLVAFEHAYAAIAQIRAFAGVEVVLENIPNEISTMERLEEFKRVSQAPDIGICYDTGHGHIQGITGGLDGIRTTHVHDNNGENDEHLWPFEGTLNWPALIEKLVLANYKGPFMFEARGEELSKGNEVRERLEELWHEAHNSIEEYRQKYDLRRG